MPEYDYQCDQCGYVRGELRLLSEWDTETAVSDCQFCELPMKKILSATPGYIKGTTTPTKITRLK